MIDFITMEFKLTVMFYFFSFLLFSPILQGFCCCYRNIKDQRSDDFKRGYEAFPDTSLYNFMSALETSDKADKLFIMGFDCANQKDKEKYAKIATMLKENF